MNEAFAKQMIIHIEDRVFILSFTKTRKNIRIESAADFKGRSFASITRSTTPNSRHQSVASSHNARWSPPVTSRCPPTQRPALPASTLLAWQPAAGVGIPFQNWRTFDLKCCLHVHNCSGGRERLQRWCLDTRVWYLSLYRSGMHNQNSFSYYNET